MTKGADQPPCQFVISGTPVAPTVVVVGARGWGLALSLLAAGLLVINGWFGGELAYRYRVGTIEDDSPEVERFHASGAPGPRQTRP